MTDWRDELQDAMYPVLTRLLQESFVLPLFVTCIGRNGSMMCGRYDDIEATGLDFIFEASHIEDEAFPLPIHMLVVDQRCEARHDKPRQHFIYLCVHLSRPCWIGGSPLISIIGRSPVEDAFCLYAASLLVKP